MVIEIALGIVLATVLLALIPYVIWAGYEVAKVVPAILGFAVAGLLLFGLARILGDQAFAALIVLMVVLWFQRTRLWALRNGRLGRWWQHVGSTFMRLLDKKPPYDEIKWLPARTLAMIVAVVWVSVLAMSVIAALYYGWTGA